MIYLGNSFSLQMIRGNCEVRVSKITSLDVFRCLTDEQKSWQSCVGHDDTAAVFTAILGVDVPCNRQSIVLNPGDVLFVGQVTGGRLPEGATTLPDDLQLSWLRVERV